MALTNKVHFSIQKGKGFLSGVNGLKPFRIFVPKKLLSKRNTMTELDKTVLDTAKKLAAYKAVDDHIEDGMVIGIGSGSTVIHAVHRIGLCQLFHSFIL